MGDRNYSAQGTQYNGTQPRSNAYSLSSSSRDTAELRSSLAWPQSTSQFTPSIYGSSYTGPSPAQPSQANITLPSQYGQKSAYYKPSRPLPASHALSYGYAASSQQTESIRAGLAHAPSLQSTGTDGYSRSTPRSLGLGASTHDLNERTRRDIPIRQPQNRENVEPVRAQQRHRSGPSGPANLTTAFDGLSLTQTGSGLPPTNLSPPHSGRSNRPQRRPSNAPDNRPLHSRNGSGSQQPHTQLFEGYRRRRGKFYETGRVFHMVLDQPHGDEVDDKSSCWTYNSFGQLIHTKPRRFIVVRSDLRSCLVVPITTYTGRGVAKEKVKKSDHCMAYSGAIVPPLGPGEVPLVGELPMQAIPIKIDPDDRLDKLDPMSRIDLATPRRVEHYAVVKNYGKVHPHSMHALVSQFANVISPGHPSRALSNAAPAALLSKRTKYSQAYHALVNFGWTHQEAVGFVNQNVRASRSTAAAAAADASSSDTEHGSQSEGEP